MEFSLTGNFGVQDTKSTSKLQFPDTNKNPLKMQQKRCSVTEKNSNDKNTMKPGIDLR